MAISTIFTQNLLNLCSEHNITNVAQLTELINIRNGEKVIDHSYLARLVKKAREGEIINPSIEKAHIIATGFNLSLRDMLVDDDFKSDKTSCQLDSIKLETAFRLTDEFCENIKAESTKFKARAFEIHYKALVNGKEEGLGTSLVLLAQEFGIIGTS